MKYNFYRELRDHMSHVYRKTVGISKKKMKRMGDPETAIRFFCELPDAGLTLDAAILADEEDYIHHGRQVFIPQNTELVEMLWRSKMDVGLSDLGGFPRCFSVAWPKGTVIEGVDLTGCMVWFGKQKDRDIVLNMMEKWMGPRKRITVGRQTPPEEHSLHVSYPEGTGINKWYVRASMPQEWLADSLRSEGDLKKRLGDYESPLVKKLEEHEVHKQYVIIRSVVNLMVYASACPDAVSDGWPENMNPGSDGRGKKPLFLASPIQKSSNRTGGHASPEPHYRNPHFRRYPIRNGKRKKGIIFISGCMVNAEIEPKTVK